MPDIEHSKINRLIEETLKDYIIYDPVYKNNGNCIHYFLCHNFTLKFDLTDTFISIMLYNKPDNPVFGEYFDLKDLVFDNNYDNLALILPDLSILLNNFMNTQNLITQFHQGKYSLINVRDNNINKILNEDN